MKFAFNALFRTHWLGRISQLLLILAILAWQARYLAGIHSPMYGWPIPFNNTWYSDIFEWHPFALGVNVISWCCLAGSLGFVVNTMLNRQYNLKHLLALHVAVALLIIAAFFEFHLRENPNNQMIYPKYATVEIGSSSVWFDVGLFSDPFYSALITRVPIIFSIGCFFFACTSLVLSTTDPNKQQSDITLQETPIVAKYALWILACINIIYALMTLTPPTVS